MSYRIVTTKRFEKSFANCLKRGLDSQKFKTVVSLLSQNGTLPLKYRPHKLSGKYSGLRECHIEPDWLLIYRCDDESLTLLLVDTGSHSDLF